MLVAVFLGPVVAFHGEGEHARALVVCLFKGGTATRQRAGELRLVVLHRGKIHLGGYGHLLAVVGERSQLGVVEQADAVDIQRIAGTDLVTVAEVVGRRNDDVQLFGELVALIVKLDDFLRPFGGVVVEVVNDRSHERTLSRRFLHAQHGAVAVGHLNSLDAAAQDAACHADLFHRLERSFPQIGHSREVFRGVLLGMAALIEERHGVGQMRKGYAAVGAAVGLLNRANSFEKGIGPRLAQREIAGGIGSQRTETYKIVLNGRIYIAFFRLFGHKSLCGDRLLHVRSLPSHRLLANLCGTWLFVAIYRVAFLPNVEASIQMERRLRRFRLRLGLHVKPHATCEEHAAAK